MTKKLLLCLGLLLSAVLAEAVEGVVDWHRPIALGFLHDGVLLELPVRPGQRVTAGTLLARLDSRGIEASLSSSKARVTARQLALAEAQRELERANELYERGQLPDHDKQLAEIAVAEAEAELAAAQAEQTRLALRLEQSTLKAPSDALILAVAASPGQALRGHCGAQPVLVITEARRRLARFRLSDRAGAAPALGQAVRLTIEGRSLQGQIEAITPAEDAGLAVAVGFELPEDLPLTPGVAVEGRW